MENSDGDDRAPALAALSICEALLVALVELKILPGTEAMGVLEDAAAAHREGDNASKAVVAIIRSVLARNVTLWESELH